MEERDATTLEGATRRGRVTLVGHFEVEVDAHNVKRALARRWPCRVDFIVGDDWRHRWKEHFKPVRIGQRLVIRPSWEPVKPLRDEVVLTLDPGQAFGTGTHETTRLVLREIDRRVQGGERVLDVGCGSGILAIAALLLGATSAHAIDVDPDAIRVTKENARRNHVHSSIRAECRDLAEIAERFDLLVANIEARVLIPMAEALPLRLKPGGVLVLSGILLEQVDEVRRAFSSIGRALVLVDGQWAALTMERRR